jgi:hypothetical protein
MGGGGSLMTHSADSVSAQSVAFKYVMASNGLPYIKFHLKKKIYSIERVKCF